ncbi:thioredoxin-like domain-containing protein [Flavobacterium sp. PLA-1-15]|uniref:thioredoxin-like domain-containing protein n=1 Tax=Flavobacterium sp. PLA-1-15 TaxID=3380533 RepID=UPI003B80133A
MKKIFLSLIVAFSTLSCVQAQKTSFDKEALNDVMWTTQQKDITFAEILKKYESKTVVIDVWASWCSDCIKGMPKVKELQKNNPDVVFLFISMDKTFENWIVGAEKHELFGEHYMVKDGMKGVFGQSIDLDWIPRYMIVDPNGKIALYKAVEADDAKIAETLKKLKQKNKR